MFSKHMISESTTMAKCKVIITIVITVFFIGCINKENEQSAFKFITDQNTIAHYLFDANESHTLSDLTGKFNGVVTGAKVVSGRFGNAFKFSNSDSITFDTILQNGMQEGTIDIILMFDKESFKDSTYALFGTQGARCNLIYKKDSLLFFKNHDNLQKLTSCKANFKQDVFYHVAVTWGKKGMCIYVDDVLGIKFPDTTNYQTSSRSKSENLFLIGSKSYVGIAPLINRQLKFEGIIDELRISNISRY